MLYLYIALVLSVSLLILLSAWRHRLFMDARRRGKLPARGRATMYDVRHLLMEGEKELALQVYCEIFNTTPLKAKRDIEELQRSLKV